MNLETAVMERLRQAGDTSPGMINLAASLLELATREAEKWTARPDDAVRIPDVLAEVARELRGIAKGKDLHQHRTGIHDR